MTQIEINSYIDINSQYSEKEKLIIPIAFCFNEKFRLPGFIAIESLLKNSGNDVKYHVFIIHDDLTEFTKEKFIELFDKYKIHILEFYFLSSEIIFEDFPHSLSWPKIVYARLYIPKLINKGYKKIIYSDVDVLFMSSLKSVYLKDIGDNMIAAVPVEIRNDKNGIHLNLESNKNSLIYMSGFIIFNCEKINFPELEIIYNYNIQKYGNQFKMFDLDLLNISFERIAKVTFDYCVLENFLYFDDINDVPELKFLNKVFSEEEILLAKNNPSIIHYAGRPNKIWTCSLYSIPKYYLNYMLSSPFFNSDNFINSKYNFFITKLLSKFAFKKQTRRIMRVKLLTLIRY